MVIWTGRGWIGFIYMVGCLIGGEYLIDAELGQGTFEANFWPKFAILLFCSALCWITGRPLNRDFPPRILAVPRAETAHETGHTLAFVRLEYAGLVAAPLYLFIALEHAGWV